MSDECPDDVDDASATGPGGGTSPTDDRESVPPTGSADLPVFPGDPTVPDVPIDRDPADPSGGSFTDPDAVDDIPTVSCSRCGREWDLAYELDDLAVGNRAVEQFAIDHERHTGHYPDGVTPWVADCQMCPDGCQFLAERPARRFARTHARHTGHDVLLCKSDADVDERISFEDA